MFSLDHIMVETDNPEELAKQVSQKMGLPYAWPLIDKEAYQSIGVNAGDVNLEFIDFKRRFGISGISFSGFSGLAFRIEGTIEEAIGKLIEAGLSYRIAEEATDYTTITVDEETIFPTIFLVKYHFDGTEWRDRLQKEFHDCQGGLYGISRIKSCYVAGNLAENLCGLFPIRSGKANRIVLTSTRVGDQKSLNGLIKNLDIELTDIT